MKTKHTFAIVMTAIALSACTGSTTTNNTETTQQPQQTTIQTTIVEQNAPSFLTQDLRMHNLFGKVKNFTTMVSDADAQRNPIGTPYEDFLKLEYDADGHFVNKVSEVANKNQIVERDGDKIIRTETPIEEFDGFPCKIHYTYNSNGFVTKMHCEGAEAISDWTYEYNTDGELIKARVSEAGEGMIAETEITYTILERDAQKNWTKRFIEYKTKQGEDDGSGNLEQDEPRYELDTRSINYW